MLLTLKLAYRFYRSRRYGPLAKFMSFASTAGICVGVSAMIISLSAVNGFEHELQRRVFDLLPSATLSSLTPYFRDADFAVRKLQESDRILAVSKVARGSGMLSRNLSLAPVAVMGVDIEQQSKVSGFGEFFTGSLERFRDDPGGIIIGKSVMDRFGLEIGESVDLILGSYSPGSALPITRSYTFTVSGYVDAGSSIDKNICLIGFDRALEIMGLGGANELHVRSVDFLTAHADTLNAAAGFKENAYLQSSLEQQAKNYNDIQMVRQIVYLAMFLIIAVATFNIVSKMIMSVAEKHSEIAILQTMGSPRSSILGVFTLSGMLLSASGIVLGLAIGILGSLYLTEMCRLIEDIFGVTLLNKNIYFIDFIPAKIMVSDLIIVVACALVMSFFASAYPALKASKLNIVEQLNG